MNKIDIIAGAFLTGWLSNPEEYSDLLKKPVSEIGELAYQNARKFVMLEINLSFGPKYENN